MLLWPLVVSTVRHVMGFLSMVVYRPAQQRSVTNLFGGRWSGAMAACGHVVAMDSPATAPGCRRLQHGPVWLESRDRMAASGHGTELK
jgi:hypothetical protein